MNEEDTTTFLRQLQRQHPTIFEATLKLVHEFSQVQVPPHGKLGIEAVFGTLQPKKGKLKTSLSVEIYEKIEQLLLHIEGFSSVSPSHLIYDYYSEDRRRF